MINFFTLRKINKSEITLKEFKVRKSCPLFWVRINYCITSYSKLLKLILLM